MKRTKKLAVFGISLGALTLSLSGIASAHVTVKPGEVVSGAFQTFNVSVPVEKDLATTAVKLEIPEGLGHVTPTVKPGWNIKTEKVGEGEEAVVKSITWSGNTIGAGFRDDFSFSAKTPDNPVELQWKAHQTYADGSVVAWNVAEDQQPKKADGSPDFSKSGPFSVTKVVSTTAQDMAIQQARDNAQSAQTMANWARYIGIGGLVLGLAAVYLATRSKD